MHSPHGEPLPDPGYCQICGAALDWRWQEDRLRPTCRACGFIRYADPKVAAAVLIGDAGRVLLGRRNIEPGRGRWSFPSGYVNRGEVVEEAAVREVREEMGVEVRLTGLVGIYSERGNPVILVVYAGEIATGVERADGLELSDVGWFPPSELPEMAFPHDDRILQDWLGLPSLEQRLPRRS